MPKKQEVLNHVFNLDSPYLTRPTRVGSIPLVQQNIALMSTWRATQPNTTLT